MWRHVTSRLSIFVLCYIVIIGIFSDYYDNLNLVSAEPCPNLCSGHGLCEQTDYDGKNVCQCFDGFFGADCSLMYCKYGYAWQDEATGTDKAHKLAECSNRGACDRATGTCDCEEIFEGQACERLSCPRNCNNHGKCLSLAYYATLKDKGEGTVFTYNNVWDAEMIYGCVCDTGYFGPDCSLRHCPTGDDPLTGTSLDPDGVQYNEKQVVTCTATGGTFTLSYKKQTTEKIPFDSTITELREYLEALTTISSDYKTAIGVAYTGKNTKACTTTGNKITIEFMQDFGDLPLLVADYSHLTHSSNVINPSITVAESVIGDKENDYCSNRGLCDYGIGSCTCSANYDTSDGYDSEGQRGDCGMATTTITACPGETACSGHGVCAGAPTYTCDCQAGYQGADCSELTCQTGKVWFDLPTAHETMHLEKKECSNMGICDREIGVCECMEGFEGGACERMSCPGYGNCNGQGTCMSMSQLALVANDNGVATDFTYGNIPNDVPTWDFDQMYGCYCDDGYEGHDCSLRSCLTGDDPETKYQLDEIQRIYCEDTTLDGEFILTFRQENTVTVSTDGTSPADLEAALESLPNVRAVHIDSQDTTKICSSSGNYFSITFLTEHGDLPLLQYAQSDIEAFSISEYQKGTKETKVCSGRGLCDYTTGTCKCFTGYASSDGTGLSGVYDDCGYKRPIIAQWEVEEYV